MTKDMKNFVIFGLGPHAQSVQYAFLEDLYREGKPVKILLLAELQDRQTDVESFLQDKQLVPEQIVGLPVEDRNSPVIHPSLLKVLEKIKSQIDGVLVCTEPKAHKKYILWALQNNIDVVTDKPITACDVNKDGPQQLWQDYLDIEASLRASTAHLTVLTNKRVHPAYKALYDVTQRFVTQYNVPITHIEIAEGGGVWNFPGEFASRENHPYKYGYGILLHTGFHYVDLLMHYQSINHLIGMQEDEISVYACGSTPFDVLHQVTQKNYEQLFRSEDFSQEWQQVDWEKYKKFGIVDALSTVQFLKEGAVITQAHVSMLQHTLSSRAWRPLPANLYLDNGRLAQNQIALFCGPLFSIYLHFNQPDVLPENESDRYVVEVYRNTALVKGKSYEKMEFENVLAVGSDQFVSLNMAAKRAILDSWVRHGQCPPTDFNQHKRSVLLTSRIFEEIFKRRRERFG